MQPLLGAERLVPSAPLLVRGRTPPMACTQTVSPRLMRT